MAEAVYRLLVWYCVMSLLTLLLFGWDKLTAVRGKWRIPEGVLHACGLLGGGAGGLLGMLLFRHKIRKPRFYILVPLYTVLQAALLVYTFLN